MKVLHIIPSVGQVRGGTSTAALDMVKALRNTGIDAEIATTNDNGGNLLDVPLNQCTEYQEVPVYFFSRFSPSVASVREFAFSSQFTIWLRRHISKYDLLHIHAIFSYPSTVAMALARFKSIPYVVIPHGLLCEWSLQQSTYKKRIYLKLIERLNLNQSRALHFTSEKEQQEVSLLGLNTPSFVLPHGLSIPSPIPNARHRLREELQIPADEPVILFLSRLHIKKGLDYLIPALSKLTHHRFTFVLAGSGSPEYEGEVESLLVSHGIRDRTHVVGFVKGERKDLLLQGSDLFALTSHSENFAVVVLEALAVGLPVLVTPGVALACIVKQHTLGYVREIDVLAIANAVDDFLKHPQIAQDMSERARQLVMEKYTWDKIACQMQQVYTHILQKNSMENYDLFEHCHRKVN